MNKLIVSDLLDRLSKNIALRMHHERWKGGPIPFYDCACIGKEHPNDPACACAMRRVYRVGSCWYEVYAGTATFLCKAVREQ